MAIASILKIKDEIAALNVERAALLQEIGLKQTELKDIVDSIEESRKRSGFLPSKYKEVEKGHLDRMEKIETDIITKKEKLEELTVKYDKLVEDIGNMGTQKSDLEQEIARLTSEAEKGRSELKAVTDDLNDLKGKYDDLKRKMGQQQAKLDKDIAEAKEELRQAKQETDKRRTEIEEEEKLLAIKRSDLEIYELRLRKKYPDEPMTFTS